MINYPIQFFFLPSNIYFIPMYLWACVLFINLLLWLDKLDHSAVKSMLLRYAPSQKGYECYGPELHYLFIWADATFFDSTPYFSN